MHHSPRGRRDREKRSRGGLSEALCSTDENISCLALGGLGICGGLGGCKHGQHVERGAKHLDVRDHTCYALNRKSFISLETILVLAASLRVGSSAQSISLYERSYYAPFDHKGKPYFII